MKRSNYLYAFSILSTIVLLLSCRRNDTRFYNDNDHPGISIFSNTGNNVLSCFIADRAWRTVDRTTSYGRITYEVFIRRSSSNLVKDTMEISWHGFYADSGYRGDQLYLYLTMPHNFTYKDFRSLNGQRLHIDGSNGYFASTLQNQNVRGMGNIYFNTAQIDSIAPGLKRGEFSGLFDITFPSLKIANGRFDHTLTTEQLTGF